VSQRASKIRLFLQRALPPPTDSHQAEGRRTIVSGSSEYPNKCPLDIRLFAVGQDHGSTLKRLCPKNRPKMHEVTLGTALAILFGAAVIH
jgi:hypothetical protein